MYIAVKENKLLLNSSLNATPIHRLTPICFTSFYTTPLTNVHRFLICALSFSVYRTSASLFPCTYVFLFFLLEYHFIFTPASSVTYLESKTRSGCVLLSMCILLSIGVRNMTAEPWKSLKKGDLFHGYEQVLVHVPIPQEEFKPETARIVIRRKNFQATKNKIGTKNKISLDIWH
jgi:hypothetical protein